MSNEFDPDEGLKNLLISIENYQSLASRYYANQEEILEKKVQDLENQKYQIIRKIQENVQHGKELEVLLNERKAYLQDLRSDHASLQNQYYDLQHEVDSMVDLQEQIHLVINQHDNSDDATEVDISDIEIPENTNSSLLFLEKARDILPFTLFQALLRNLESFVKKEISQDVLVQNVSDILLPNYEQLYQLFSDSFYPTNL